MAEIVEVVGIYDADGGLPGEVAYVVGHLLGRAECALCDVTHSPVRRKPAWDAMVARIPVPVRVVHRNETSDDERMATASSGLPVVLARRANGAIDVLLDHSALTGLDGSVDAFEAALRRALPACGTS
ncbi:MAG: hypothetical protein ACRCXL_06805 [Dermatophilaceae bacterium]